MRRRPPDSSRTATFFPYTTLCRSDRGRDRAPLDVGKALRREDDRRIFLAERLQPFLELVAEHLVVEREPALVDQDQRRAPVETPPDPVEEIGEHCGRRRGADQVLDRKSTRLNSSH